MNRSAGNRERRRLRVLIVLFFVALAVPSAVLTWQAYSRLKWETLHHYQSLAETMLDRVDRRLRELVAREEARSFGDYRFLVVEGAPEANYRERSPLSRLPAADDLPGLLGHFQVDAAGRFTTPLLPDDPTVSALAYGIGESELADRQALRERLLQILSREVVATADVGASREVPGSGGAPPPAASSDVVATLSAAARPPGRPQAATPGSPVPFGAPASKAADGSASASFGRTRQDQPDSAGERQRAQAAYKRLSEATVRGGENRVDSASFADAGPAVAEQTTPDTGRQEPPAAVRRALSTFRKRLEIEAEPIGPLDDVVGLEALGDAMATPADEDAAPPLVRMFQSELEPFRFAVVDDGHLVLYRTAWRDAQRFIQGLVIDRSVLLRELIEWPFRETALADMSRLVILYDGKVLATPASTTVEVHRSVSDDLSGTPLYRGRLSTPLDRLELALRVTRVPAAPATALVIWMAVALGLVLSVGLWLMYRLGARQIALNRQQRDFVSAVSHELKTPLTSIRMYSEMLREGWADEKRRRSYYDFIHDESERLSRLIGNVLQLARMGRDELRVEMQAIDVGRLVELVGSKVSTQAAASGFELRLNCDDAALASTIEVDRDAFVQILINLVDNAVKFSAQAEEKRIDIGCARLGDGRVEFRVRDRGPGIPRDQLKKIFLLFYRSENELTRETVGTGIGLALVHRLVSAMAGEVDVVNRDPGAEFRVRFPARCEGSV